MDRLQQLVLATVPNKETSNIPFKYDEESFAQRVISGSRPDGVLDLDAFAALFNLVSICAIGRVGVHCWGAHVLLVLCYQC